MIHCSLLNTSVVGVYLRSSIIWMRFNQKYINNALAFPSFNRSVNMWLSYCLAENGKYLTGKGVARIDIKSHLFKCLKTELPFNLTSLRVS